MHAATRLASALVLALGATGLATAGPGGPPANDDCATPEVLTGTGFFPFDTTGATTGLEGQYDCGGAGDGVANDVWFCWTATCTGTVRLTTCGTTALDTRLNLWAGCDCPEDKSSPLCCADDECGLQSILECEVVCGQQYMIQLGQRPDGTPGGPGELLIECLGDCPPPPEPGPCDIVEGQCCAGRPAFDAPDYLAFGGGPVAVITASPGVIGNQVLTVYDYTDFSSATPNTNFPVARYSAPNWTGGELGSIFGAALDATGNIYVTPTIIYSFDAVGVGTLGDVYRVDSVTGAVSVFTTSALPNASGVGLGNIAYDCAHDQFFVTNWEDGLIYRLDAAGNVLSTFDHGVADDPTVGIAPLGDRPWAVAVHGDRGYYSIWSEDAGRPSAAAANTVWSVDLAGGDFSGSETLRVTLPPEPGRTYSNPVSDLRFTMDGRLFLAERSMVSDGDSGAHDSRLLEYVCVDGTWTPGADYFTGVIGDGRNSAGGVDVDYRTGERVWVTADAIQFTPDTIYGAQGLPDGGGDVTTSVLVDYQGNLDQQDKTSIGDIEISCPEPCGAVEVIEIECLVDEEGFFEKYEATISVTNDSGVDVHYLLFPGPAVQPNIVHLDPPLPDGSKVLVDVAFCDLAPGETHCLPMVMADENVDECCVLEICFETPECDCLIVPSTEVGCDADGNVLASIDFVNLSSFAAEHAFIIVESPAGATVSPDYVDLPTTPPFGSGTIGPLTIVGAGAADEICLRITIHAEDLVECCSEVVCFDVPDCAIQEHPGDLDGDGTVGFGDLVILLSLWGPCDVCAADLDGDGVVGFTDLVILLAAWS